MMRDITLLVNPVCGAARGLRLVAPVVKGLRRADVKVHVAYGRGPTEAEALAHRAVDADTDVLVALGGDGLANVALQAVAGTRTALGIIPAGTGNDIARSLGIPTRDPLAAVDVVLRGTSRLIDAGRLGGRWFAGVASAGFDSLVTERANRMTRPQGQARYVAALAAELRVLRPLAFTIELDGRPWEAEAVLVSVGNGISYGGGMRICPDADLGDGLLDITVVGPVSRAELVRFFPTVYRGRHLSHPAVTAARARTISLSASGVTAYADGEPFGPLPVTCESVPRALRVIAPPTRDTPEEADVSTVPYSSAPA